MDLAGKIKKNLKKKIEDKLFDRMPDELQEEFIAAGGILDFNIETSQLSITNCPGDLAERAKEAMKD